MQGFHHRGEFDPPEWANNLKNYYWHIRVEGRDKAKRQKFYRLIRKEKLRLAEMNIHQELINAVCKYLITLSKNKGHKMELIRNDQVYQLSLIFGD